MHCSQAFSSGSVKGVVIVDVSYDAVLELLQELNFGGESLVSFVTADGRMISVNNPVDSGLIDTAESSSYVKVDGRRYYYMSAESSVTGGSMSSVMESMIQELDEMNARRHAVLDKIRAIGDSSEHTVRTTEEVNRFLGQQMEDSEALKSEVVKMMDSMKQLENAIETFRLN